MFCLAQRINRYKSLSSNNQRRPGGCGVQIIILVVVDIVFDDSVQLRQGAIKAAFSLGCFGGGGAAPPYCPNISAYQCFRGCCIPHKSHGIQSWLYSMIISKQFYTCKYKAINCTIVTLANDKLDSRLVL